MKAYMYANVKAKRTNIQESYVFADLMYIFSENGSSMTSYLLLTSSFNTTKHTFNTYMEGSNKRSKFVYC